VGDGVGPTTLIIIDEAGMADTLSLDTSVRFAISRGASVRLVGDDQQLAAIGAGGVLRDIKNTHGALRLTELHRFTDPAEAQPRSLCGKAIPAHSASISIMAVFMSVISPRSPRTCLLLGFPTGPWTRRDHARSDPRARRRLNRRARDHRIGDATVGQEVRLGDGNRPVSATDHHPSNDRRLRLSATDWVKKRRPVDHHPHSSAR
jgi:hypothetical protein